MTQIELFKRIRELGNEITYLSEQNARLQSSLNDLIISWDAVNEAVESMEDEGEKDDA